MKNLMKNLMIILCFLIIGCNQNKFEAVQFFIQSQEYDKAELILDNMSKYEKESFDYNYLKGFVLIKKSLSGNKREALKLFLKANEYNSKNYMNNLFISKMFVEINKLSDAEYYALNAEKLFTNSVVHSYEDDVYYLLAKIYYSQGNYTKALETLTLSDFNDNEFVIFLKAEIEDLKNDTNILEVLIKDFKQRNLFSSEMKFDYFNYLLIRNHIDAADRFATNLINENSDLSRYYGHIFKAYINLLRHNYDLANSCIEKSYDYIVDDSRFLRYKIKFLFTFLSEQDSIKIFNSFLIYKFFYDNNEEETLTANNDLSYIFDYFKSDVWFNLIISNNSLYQ